jgi:hypothetical protein
MAFYLVVIVVIDRLRVTEKMLKTTSNSSYLRRLGQGCLLRMMMMLVTQYALPKVV